MTTIDQQHVNESYLKKAGEILAPMKSSSYAALELPSKRNLLDVGCGPGIDAMHMAKLATPDTHITGVDFDERMIIAATETAKNLGLSDKLSFQKADAYELPFSDDTFCATRSERMLMHLESPEKALQEMVRVTRPGGKIVVIDSDWATLSSATGNDVLERKLSQHLVSDMLPSGFSGRNLPGQFNDLGLHNIEISVQAFYVNDPNVWRLIVQAEQIEQSAIANGIASQDELSQWHQAIEQHHEAGKFHATLCLTMATGVLPEA